MTRYLQTLLVLILAVATAGAQVLCACANSPLPAPKGTDGAAEQCVGEGECCRKEDAKTQAPSHKEEPCEKCNLKHKVPQVLPDTKSAAPTLTPAYDALLIPFDIAPVAVATSGELRLMQETPPPPLLQDLFSAHTLLLI